MRTKKFVHAVMALAVSGMLPMAAFADQVVNNLDVSVDAGLETMNLAVGASGTTTYRLIATNGDGDNNCNINGSGEAVTFAVQTSNGNATVSPSTITFNQNCNSTKLITVTAVNPGTTNVTLSQTANNTGGSYDVSTAAFQVVVAAPPADTTKPVITATVSPSTPNGTNGWYTSPVTVSFTCADTGANQSGIATNTVAADNQTLSSDGMNLSVSSDGACVDAAGNVADTPVTVSGINIDQTAPTILATVFSGTTGANGWYTSDVVVHYNCGDNFPGMGECPENVTLSAEGESVAAPTPVVTDAAGNESLPSNAIIVKIDKTAPTAVALNATGTEGDNDWFASDVSVTTAGTDTVSGVTCTEPQEFTDETAGTTVSGSCTNGAGLTTAAEDISIKLDKTGPSAEMSVTDGTLGANDWYISDVEVTTTGADTLSDVTCTPVQTFSADSAEAVVNGSCTNEAGLETAADALTIKIDQTAPTAVELAVTAGTLGTNGWYKTGVTVATTGTDAISGVTCTADQNLTTDTAGTTVNGSCTNGAGLTTNGDALEIKIDQTAPTVNIATPVNGAVYFKTSTVLADWSTSDATSGIATEVATTADGAAINTATTGLKNFTVTATDAAGNVTTVTNTYDVQTFVFGGLQAPLSLNSKDFNKNSTIPVKFKLTLGGAPSSAGIATLYIDNVLAIASGNSNVNGLFRYDPVAGQYIFNLSTKQLTKGSHAVKITLNDGTQQTFTIVVK